MTFDGEGMEIFLELHIVRDVDQTLTFYSYRRRVQKAVSISVRYMFSSASVYSNLKFLSKVI